MAYRFIDEHQKEFGLRWLLRHMNIRPNAYYNHLKDRKASYRAGKEEICSAIKEIYHSLNGVPGHRVVRIFLARKGISLSKATVHKYMNRELRLQCVCRRKRPGYRKGSRHLVYPDLLGQTFAADSPNRVWCTDFTYLYLSNGTVRYNCSIIDLYDRSVVASENGRWITSDLAIRALQKALNATGCRPEDLILHSDQGSQYTSFEFTSFCKERGIVQSMSHSGCPYDNAPMERYYNTLKEELTNQYLFRTAGELDRAVSEFAFGWYNQIRPHSYDGYRTPYEKRFGLA